MRMRSVGRRNLTGSNRFPTSSVAGDQRRRVDAVSGADDGVDDRRLTQLAAQRHHRDPHGRRERVGVLVPHPVEQLLAADHRAVRGEQRLEDPELLAGQVDQLAAAASPCAWTESSSMSPAVSTGGAAGVVRRPSARTRATSSANANGLAQVVVGTQREAGHLVLDGAARGQHHDPRQHALVGEPAADLVAGHARQVTVEHDHVVAGQRCLAVARRRRRTRRRRPSLHGAGRVRRPPPVALRPRRRGSASVMPPWYELVNRRRFRPRWRGAGTSSLPRRYTCERARTTQRCAARCPEPSARLRRGRP